MSATTWEESADNYKHTSEACPRSRWTPDAEVDHCEHPGCTVTFGKFGLPGLSIQTQSTSTDTSSSRDSLHTITTAHSSWSRKSRNGYFEYDGSNSKQFLSPTTDTFTPGLHTTPALSPFSSQTIGKGREDWSISLASILSIKLNRRHHCRRCGSCFCDTHSSRTTTVILTEEDYDEMRKSQGLPLKRSITSVNDWSRSVHARVCDMCYTLCQKAKHQYERALCKPKDDFTLHPESMVKKILTPTEPRSPTGEAVEESKETIEEAMEYAESKVRLYRETQRHLREGIRLLCNDPAVSRIAASAVKSKGSTTSPKMCDIIAISPVLVSHQDTIPHWEEGVIRKREKEVANRAMSLDAFERQVRSQVLPFVRWDSVDDAEEEEWMSQLPLIIERSKRPVMASSQRPYTKTRATTLPPTPCSTTPASRRHQRRSSKSMPGSKEKQLGLARILEHQQIQEAMQLRQQQQQQQQHRAFSPIKGRTKGVKATTRDT